MYHNNIIQLIHDSIATEKQRSAWDRGVSAYALELLEDIDLATDSEDILTNHNKLERAALNGADDWHCYSLSGCSLAYDSDIAARLCTPSELKKVRNGNRRPNSCEDWLDVQARALYQAFNRVKRHVRKVVKQGG